MFSSIKAIKRIHGDVDARFCHVQLLFPSKLSSFASLACSCRKDQKGSENIRKSCPFAINWSNWPHFHLIKSCTKKISHASKLIINTELAKAFWPKYVSCLFSPNFSCQLSSSLLKVSKFGGNIFKSKI